MPVRSMQHLGMALPDIEVARRFYADFGLEMTTRGDLMVARCFGREQDQIVITEGHKKAVHHVCFGTRHADELTAIKRKLEGSSTRLIDPPQPLLAEGIWFHDPDGVLVNIRVEAPAPGRTEPELLLNSPGHTRRVNRRGYPDPSIAIQPRRLCHFILFTPDLVRKRQFYIEVLGLELSDYVGNFIAFLRTPPPSDHHVIGFMQSDRPGLHHIAFEVGTIDEIEMGARRMLDKGYTDVWGLNRHVQGSNYFHYLRDPWQSMVEYTCDIDFIDDSSKWPPKDGREMPGFAWGAPMPADFGKNFDP